MPLLPFEAVRATVPLSVSSSQPTGICSAAEIVLKSLSPGHLTLTTPLAVSMLTLCPATGGGMPGPGSVLRPRTELWTGLGASSLVAATRKAYWVSGVRPAMLAVSPFWVTAAAIVFAGVWVALCGEAAGQYSNQASAGRLRGLTLALRTAVLEVIPWASVGADDRGPDDLERGRLRGVVGDAVAGGHGEVEVAGGGGGAGQLAVGAEVEAARQVPRGDLELRAGRLGRGLEGVGVVVADHAAGQLGRGDLRLGLPE